MGRKRSRRKSKYPRSSIQDSQSDLSDSCNDPAVFAEVESLFKKQFTFSSQDDTWVLPPTETWFTGQTWSDGELMQNKEMLNEVKGRLSDQDIKPWHEHTQFTNRAGSVIQHVRRHKKPELCTQAWCKFHEIVGTFPILPDGIQKDLKPCEDALGVQKKNALSDVQHELQSVHLCEAPGAFITSLNHYLKCRDYRGEWRWTANTLNPYYEGNNLSEMIADDRFILDTLTNWYFGPDNSGDIMSQQTILGFRDHIQHTGLAHLVTCDGSVDCQNQPGEQEMLVSPLHHAEVTASLLLLSPGGSLVLKMFTLFESSSVCLMFLLNCLFTKVNVFKPATSKAGNSEVYVVCVGYKGCSQDVTDKLLATTGKTLPTGPVFSLDDIPETYMVEHRQCSQVFMRFQTQTIEENISLFKYMSTERYNHLTAVRQHCANTYVDRFMIRPLPPHAYIVPPFLIIGHQPRSKVHQTLNRKCHSGSYIERQTQLCLSWEDQLSHAALYNVQHNNPHWIKGYNWIEDEDLTSWPVVCGKFPGHVESSQFSEPAVLQWYNALLIHQTDRNQPAMHFNEVKGLIESICVTAMDEGQESQKFNIVQLDPSVGRLLHFLYKTDQFQVCDQVNEEGVTKEDQTSRVFVCESGVGDTSMASWTPNQLLLLEAILKMYQAIKGDDHCVLLLPDLLTRFSVGIVYLLFASFEQICVCPVRAESAASVAVIGQRFTSEGQEQILTCLRRVITSVTSQQQPSSYGVLQITPIHVLFESEFYSYVCWCNDVLLKTRSDQMLKQQREHLVQSEEHIAEFDKSDQHSAICTDHVT